MRAYHIKSARNYAFLSFRLISEFSVLVTSLSIIQSEYEVSKSRTNISFARSHENRGFSLHRSNLFKHLGSAVSEIIIIFFFFSFSLFFSSSTGNIFHNPHVPLKYFYPRQLTGYFGISGKKKVISAIVNSIMT